MFSALALTLLPDARSASQRKFGNRIGVIMIFLGAAALALLIYLIANDLLPSAGVR